MTKPRLTRRAWTAVLASWAAPRLAAQTPAAPAAELASQAAPRLAAQTPAAPGAELDQARDRLRRAADQLRKAPLLPTAAEPAFRFEA
jgi:hypothetical protein